jgi:hypothetical protein
MPCEAAWGLRRAQFPRYHEVIPMFDLDLNDLLLHAAPEGSDPGDEEEEPGYYPMLVTAE